MLTDVVIALSALCAVVPALLFCVNLRRYRLPAPAAAVGAHSISVLIPARNEEANIGTALLCVLASHNVDMEVLVLDDDSTDRTGDIVRSVAATDPRVRLVCGRGLPPGWNGKQHACWVLAGESSNDLLVFLDADVRVAPALLQRMASFRQGAKASLVSGFPQLITETWLEQLLLPLIHFVLLGFLPMGSMRRSTRASFAAGCGQFMMVDRTTYFASGGHGALRETMHDGLMLPRCVRSAGYKTDLADITELASVRMYDSAVKVWFGLAKNATEGIASAGKILPLTAILLAGQVLPAILAVAIIFGFVWVSLLGKGPGVSAQIHAPRAVLWMAATLVVSLIASYLPRLLAVRRFHQPLRSALLHPLGILLLLAVQWYALGRKVFGRPVGWRQRTYSSETGTQVG